MLIKKKNKENENAYKMHTNVDMVLCIYVAVKVISIYKYISLYIYM